jgi:fatty-acyl-CoA synthase
VPVSFWDAITSPKTLRRRVWEWDGAGFRQGTYADLFESSRKAAGKFRSLGLERGATVAAVITNSHEAIAGVVGAWLAGARVASLPIIARGMSIEGYVAQLSKLVSTLGCPILVAEDRFLSLLPEGLSLDAALVSFEALADAGSPLEPDPLPGEEVAFYQFSSGSTGEPKAVALQLGAIEDQLFRLTEAMAIDPARDVGVTWLPMSHDMGLFGCTLMAWVAGMSGLRSPPERFLASPATWLADCAAVGATVTAAPPFALNLAGRAAAKANIASLGVRTWLIGGDHIEWIRLSRALAALAPLGVTASSLTPAYGLAEDTLAVTLGGLADVPPTITVDRTSLMAQRLEFVPSGTPDSACLVGLGEPLRSTTVRIAGTEVGEICVRTPSLAVGYHNAPQASAATFVDGELRTGDIGLTVDGQLYVVGRLDDVMVIGGRNVHVRELELELSHLPGLRAGNCAIIDPRDGSGTAALVAEIRAPVADRNALESAVRRMALQRAGIGIARCEFVQPGGLPKTPSGKIQRFRCRDLLT